MNSKRSRIMMADDHVLVTDACKLLLEPEYDVVATVGDGRALKSSAELVQCAIHTTLLPYGCCV